MREAEQWFSEIERDTTDMCAIQVAYRALHAMRKLNPCAVRVDYLGHWGEIRDIHTRVCGPKE